MATIVGTCCYHQPMKSTTHLAPLLCALALFLAGTAATTELSVQIHGQAVQGGLLTGKVAPGSQVRYQDQSIKVADDGTFLIGFGRDHQGDAEISVLSSQGGEHTHRIAIATREYKIQRIDGLPPQQVTPPAEVLERIAEDSRQVALARDRNDDRLGFSSGFVWPAKGPLTGVYGSQRVLNGEPRRPHFGVDVGGPTGTPVYAPAAGIVTLAHPDMYYSGGTLIVDHGHQLSSTFLHLSSIEVELGQHVQQGDLIGRIGATGRATGPHLDWRMNWGKVRIDPQLLVTGLPSD